mmetsp:Transcript_13092/g.23552  ORF Transcript_13092/g.23552 Transcript_13092/m.23552 type:complete len:239 (-) Transcript_13092:766-1482(-)
MFPCCSRASDLDFTRKGAKFIRKIGQLSILVFTSSVVFCADSAIDVAHHRVPWQILRVIISRSSILLRRVRILLLFPILFVIFLNLLLLYSFHSNSLRRCRFLPIPACNTHVYPTTLRSPALIHLPSSLTLPHQRLHPALNHQYQLLAELSAIACFLLFVLLQAHIPPIYPTLCVHYFSPDATLSLSSSPIPVHSVIFSFPLCASYHSLQDSPSTASPEDSSFDSLNCLHSDSLIQLL